MVLVTRGELGLHCSPSLGCAVHVGMLYLCSPGTFQTVLLNSGIQMNIVNRINDNFDRYLYSIQN